MWQTLQTILERAWQLLQDQAVQLLPGILAGLVIVFLGVLLGWIAGRVADRLLRAVQLDRRAERLGLAASLESIGILSTVSLLARALQWLVILLALVLALYALNASLAEDLALRFFLYLPHLLVAALILCLGTLLSRFLARSVLIAAVNAEMRSARLLSGLTRVVVALVAVAVALEHLGIGRATVLAAFCIVFGAAMLTVAIAWAARNWCAAGWQRDSRRSPPGNDRKLFITGEEKSLQSRVSVSCHRPVRVMHGH